MEAYKKTLLDLADPISRMEAEEEEAEEEAKNGNQPKKLDYDVLPPAQVPKLFNPAVKKEKVIVGKYMLFKC
jgi:hypothetical protein